MVEAKSCFWIFSFAKTYDKQAVTFKLFWWVPTTNIWAYCDVHQWRVFECCLWRLIQAGFNKGCKPVFVFLVCMWSLAEIFSNISMHTTQCPIPDQLTIYWFNEHLVFYITWDTKSSASFWMADFLKWKCGQSTSKRIGKKYIQTLNHGV